MNRDKLTAIFNDASEAVLILDSYGKIVFFNTSAATLLDYHLSEIENHSIFTLLENDSYQNIRTFIAFKNAFQHPSTLDEQAVLIKKNGKRQAVHLTITRIAYEESDIFMAILEKLSDETNIAEEKKVTQSNMGVVSSYQDPKELLLLFDTTLRIKYISNNIYSMLQYTPQELIDSSLQDLIHADDHEKIKSKANIAGKGIVSLQSPLRLRNKQANYIQMEGSQDRYYDERGQLMYGIIHLTKSAVQTFGDTHNINKLMADNADLLQRKQLLDIIFNHLSDTVLILDQTDYHLIDFNEQAVRMFEAESKDHFAQDFTLSSLILKNDEEGTLHFLLQNETLSSAISDIQYVTLRGKPFWGKTYLIDLTYDDSIIRIIQISDITQQKLLEEKLQFDKSTAEQALKSREDFLSTMTHEIRTPLNAVLGMTHLMLQKEPREDQKKLLQTLKFAGENLTALINDILDYSKIEAGKLELNRKDFNLQEFINGIKLTYKNLANEKGLLFRLLLEEELPVFVHGDANRLGQILNNLLNNAIKFTKEGQIVVSVYVEEEQEEQYILLFEVSDTGIGIPEDKQEVIFDPYQQASSQTAAKFGGTGLGLSIVRNLVTLQKGELSLQSKEGEGSTFKVKLPFGKPENPEHSNENESNNFILSYQSLEGLRVLYVEDVIPNQLLMEGLCDNWKIDLDTALNGLEALEKVRKNQYDLILMDIQMPEKDGYETAMEIRSLKDPHYENIPIIALSASVSEKTQERIREVGMNDYLPKPIDPKNLHEKLYKFSKSVSKDETSIQSLEDEAYKIGTMTYATDMPDFSQLHRLYLNDDAGYIRILEQIRKLTLESIEPVINSVRINDKETFRFTCHKLMSYIRLLNLQRLEKLMEEAKGYLTGEAEFISRNYIATELEYHFNYFINKINQEIAKHN